jgi:hypothetical protein
MMEIISQERDPKNMRWLITIAVPEYEIQAHAGTVVEQMRSKVQGIVDKHVRKQIPSRSLGRRLRQIHFWT